MASRTDSAASTWSTSKRRVDKSGPITASRMRRKCVRNTRCNLRKVRSGGSPSAMVWRNEIGGAKRTMVVRPLSKTDSRRRKRPTSAQFSENSTANQPLCLSGARPTKIDTGTRCTSRSARTRCACSNLASESEWVLPPRCSGISELLLLRRESAR